MCRSSPQQAEPFRQYRAVAPGLTKSLITLLVVATLVASACSSDRTTMAVEDLKLEPCPPIRAVQVNPDMLHVEIRAVVGGKVGRRLNTAPYGANPVASPDGRSIAYEASTGYSDGLGLLEAGVNVVGVSGDDDRALTHETLALVAWKRAGIVAKRRLLPSDAEALVVIDPRTGSAKTVWKAPGRIEVVGWSRATTAIAATSVGVHTELWTVDVTNGRTRLRYQADGGVTPSRDLKRVAVVRALTPAVSATFAGPLNGTLTEVPGTRGAALPIGWTDDGWLLVFKNRRGSHDRVHAFRNGVERPVLTDIGDPDPVYGRLLDRLSCTTLHAEWYLA
jgi:hypothetical protein